MLAPRGLERKYYTRCVRGAHSVRAQCVYWDDFVDLPTCSTIKCMYFQAVKGIIIAHATLHLFTSFTYVSFMASCGHHYTYTRSNGDRVPANVISACECGQYMSIQ